MPTERLVRAARPGELGAAAALAERAFRSRPVGSTWAAYLGDNPHLGPGDLLLALEGAEPVGLAAGLRLRASLAGEDVPVRGLAAVAVAPERRRAGVATALVRAMLRAGHERGEPLSLLFAYRLPFYRALGYGLVEARDQLRAPPGHLLASPLRANVARFEARKHGKALRAIYERARAGTTGQLKRDEHWWRRRVFARALEGAVYLKPGGGEPAGYALYEVDDRAPGGPQCRVLELRAASGEAVRGLLGFFASLGDQYALVSLAVARDEALALVDEHGLGDAPPAWAQYDPFAVTKAGAMGRVVHLARAFAAHPGARRELARGALGLDLEDPVIAEQSGAYDLELGPRGAQLARGARAAERVALSIDRLSQIYFGAASARTLVRLGVARGSERAARLLDELFAGPLPFVGTLNGF
ncbi:MAG TPA: GNAT family N-acetyltransferase [Polyangiaceae bacterium]|nr:GNAT family N-acetyltransferase [Polyangiaceae bacterium]